MKFFAFLILALSLVCASADVTVEAIGFGITPGQAKNDALRNAVEQGCGVKIFSETEVRDFVALKDVLVSESFGMVTSYTIVYEKARGEDYEVKVRAVVSANVQKDWAKMKIILKQKGNPSVMFCFKEILDGQELAQATGEYELMSKFKELGFRVIDRQSIAKGRELQKELYNMDSNLDGVIAVASQHGADLLVTGMFEGRFVQIMNYWGQQGIQHQYTFSAKVIQTDNSEVIAPVTGNYNTNPMTKNTMLYTKESAGISGFKQVVSEEFFQSMIVKMVTHWIRDIQEGTSMELIVSNVSFRDRKFVQNILENKPDLITEMKVGHYRNRRLTIQVKSKLSAEELAEALEELEDFEVVELQNNRLEIQYVK
ncbi:MAG TPA: hypothetical protein PKM32_01305 [Planctomycetota bacterium]|jgi:hypothetical protein|nr:hypothetical protein [Planctomycetota bacterium]HON45006.1 hypothetical protein [Planctomycetota bacterium]HPY74457.1 hypothetical protein [Planctomycetota bacterium]HQB00009.1 hypothetical protein [Planctomycetota bacterium]HRU50937.1 hypothetical protein [Planctomycetota bacterium]